MKRKYNPMADNLMPRMQRKIKDQQSSIGGKSHMSSLVQDSKQLSVYNNETSTFGSKNERYSLVNHPLRTKTQHLINTSNHSLTSKHLTLRG